DGGVAGLDGVVEGECGCAGAGGVVGGSGCGSGVEGQLRGAGDGDVFAEGDRDGDHAAGGVGAVGGARADRADRRRGGVDDDVLVGAEAVGGAGAGEGEGGGVGGGVLDRAAGEGEGGRGSVVEVGGGISRSDRVVEDERRGARARAVARRPRGR